MQRLLTTSGLFTLVLFAAASSQEPAIYWERTVVGSDYPYPFQFVRGQPQPNPASKADDKKAEKKAEKKADPTDAAVAAALANDADVRMAKAKIQLAEAELAKARQAVTLKVVSLKAKIDQLKVDLRAAEDRLTLTTQMFQRAATSQSELLTARDRVETTKSALALAETEWKLLTGSAFGSPVADLTSPDAAVAAGLQYLTDHGHSDAARLAKFALLMEAAREREAVKGPVPDRLRAALDKPVKLGAKGEKITFEKALEVFKKEAGLDVPVRGAFPKPRPVLDEQGRPVLSPGGKPLLNQVEGVVSEGEELPVGAWFQLFEDSAAAQLGKPFIRFYVREYGLLISTADSAPDAPTLTEFWKQKPLAKEPKGESKPK